MAICSWFSGKTGHDPDVPSLRALPPVGPLPPEASSTPVGAMSKFPLSFAVALWLLSVKK